MVKMNLIKFLVITGLIFLSTFADPDENASDEDDEISLISSDDEDGNIYNLSIL